MSVPLKMCQFAFASIRGEHFSHTSWYEELCKSLISKLKHRCVKYLTNEWVFNLALKGMERHDKVLLFFFCFTLLSIISLECMCRFCQLCLGSPLRSEIEAQNGKKNLWDVTHSLKCTSEGESLPATRLPLYLWLLIHLALIGLIENLNARFVFLSPQFTN